MDNTMTYNVNDFKNSYIIETLKEVVVILKERGYNPVNQITGYLMSGDPGYITSYKDARKLICSIDRAKIIELLINGVIK